MERLSMTSVLLVILLAAAQCQEITLPKVRILVHVRRRAAKYWEPWQLNSNICPQSICRSSDEHGTRIPRPRGTGGTVFYQGDIILNKEYEKFIFGSKRTRRATIRLKDHLWKNGIVPYEYSPEISREAKKIVRKAIRHIEQRTCIKFRRKRTKDKDYIRYISDPGCWSNVGKKGGRQLISIGRGCENLGVAVHETIHALGMWHEQARADRDQYVEILKENISPRFLPDFNVVNRRVSTSRGSPYDYQSVMHYSRMAFTRNGNPTIKVIGVGKELGLAIGQREAMSNLDMAQLRDMYRCTKKQDANDTVCPKDWIKWKASCYKFHDHPKAQYSRAQRLCVEEKARLLVLESKGEERFITKYLNTQHKNTHIWRLGGKTVNGTMKWEAGAKTRPMRYSNWAPGQPSTYSSLALIRNRTTNSFQWHGVWLGSLAQLPRYKYSFICEKRAKRPCLPLDHKDGRDYRGKLDHTVDGYTCQDWTSQYPHKHPLKPDPKNDRDGLGKHNFCRNPSSLRRKRPWCYTTRSKREWQYCDVTTCSKEGAKTPGSSNAVQKREVVLKEDNNKKKKKPTKKIDKKKKNLKKDSDSSQDKKVASKPKRKETQKGLGGRGSAPSKRRPRLGTSAAGVGSRGRRQGRPQPSGPTRPPRPPSRFRPGTKTAVPARPRPRIFLSRRRLVPPASTQSPPSTAKPRPSPRSRPRSRGKGGNSYTGGRKGRVPRPTRKPVTPAPRRVSPRQRHRKSRTADKGYATV